jgi:hypothetical protein
VIDGDQTKILARFNKAFSAAKAQHGARVAKYDKCDAAYNAVLKPKQDDWQSDLHPPYVMQIVELLASNMIDENQRAKVVSSQPLNDDSAELHEHLLNQQREIDRYGEKLVPFILQALIRGVTIAKVPWLEEWRKVKVRQYSPSPFGQDIGKVTEQRVPFRQQPGFVVVDAKQFLWDPAAHSLDDATHCFHVTYDTMDSLKLSGVYENVDKIQAVGSPSDIDGGSNKNKGRVEVIEWWRKQGDEIWLTTVANRGTVLRNESSPFWHGEFPFVVASPMPSLFQIGGHSVVEMIADIQAALWEMQNHRLDNTRFMSNAAVFVDPSAEQQDFRMMPGAILRARPDQIQPWQPNTSIIAPSVQAEELLKGDLQNLSGAVAYLSGATQTGVDQTTATGITTIQNMATKRIMRMKQQVLFALKRVGEQQISLNQQLLPPNVAIRIDRGATGVDWKAATPAMLQGKYEYVVEDAAESLIRQEKRAEALAKANFLTANYMLLKQDGIDLDLRKVVEDVTEAFNEQPTKYFKEPAPTQPTPQLVGGGGAAAAPTPEAMAAAGGQGAMPAPQAAAPAEAGAAVPPPVGGA